MALTTNQILQATGANTAQSITPAAVAALLPVFVAGSTGIASAKGLAPAAAFADQTKFLRGDGTWQTIASGIQGATGIQGSNGSQGNTGLQGATGVGAGSIPDTVLQRDGSDIVALGTTGVFLDFTGGEVYVAAADSVVTNTGGQSVFVLSGIGDGTGDGGNIEFTTGDSGAHTGNGDGGDFIVTAGQGAKFGGDIQVTAGSGAVGGSLTYTGGAGATGLGGYISFKGGQSTSNSGGAVALTGGDSDNAGRGGDVVITGGQSFADVGGGVTIAGGQSPTGGDINITGGLSSSNAIAGSVNINAGYTAGTAGTINIGVGNAAPVNISQMGQTTTVNGDLNVSGTSGNVTLAGNLFNGTGQLVQLDGMSGALPSLDGSNLYNLPGGAPGDTDTTQANTFDDTPTVIRSFTPDTGDEVVTIEATLNVSGSYTGMYGREAACYRIMGTFMVNSGTVTQIGSTTTLHSVTSGPAYGFAFNINSGSIEFVFTGINDGGRNEYKMRFRMLTTLEA